MKIKSSSEHADDEFFIGYLTKAPENINTVLKKTVIAIFSLGVVLSLTLVVFQRKFSSNDFEYGVSKTLEGNLFQSPFPHLKLAIGPAYNGDTLYQTILLVGAGKMGANPLLESISSRRGMSIEGVFTSVTGNLIGGEGQSLLQVNDTSDIVIISEKITREISNDPPVAVPISMRGEIVDPKCYFGVMKPGEGKPHRSCAIRCISGGIPPVFKSINSEYYLLQGDHLQMLNEEVLNIVGDQVVLHGEVHTLGTWKVLKVNSTQLALLSASKSPLLLSSNGEHEIANCMRDLK